MKVKSLKIYPFIIFFMLSLLNSLTAISQEDYYPKSALSYVPNIKAKYRIVDSEISRRTDISLSEKLQLMEKEMNKLKSEFRAKRKEDYEAIRVSRSVEHGCSSSSSGGVKDCGERWVRSPSDNMITSYDLSSVEGDKKGLRLSEDRKQAFIKMTVAGKGKNKGTLTSIFIYNPERIPALVEIDLTEVFLEVVKK